MLKYVIVGSIVLSLGYLLTRGGGAASAAKADEGRKLFAEGAVLLDVRTPEEYRAGHVEGALNIPVQELEQRLSELGQDKSKPVVIYCRSGRRSKAAQGILEQRGFNKVLDIGPMPSWN